MNDTTRKRIRWIVAPALAATTALGIGAAVGVVPSALAQEAQEAQEETVEPPGNPMAEVFDALVSSGTITQAQADAIKSALEAKLKELGKNGPAKRHLKRHMVRDARIHDLLTKAAEVIGIEVDELRDELRDDKSLAQVAEEHDVSADELTQALIDDANATIDAKVKEGKIDAERADDLKERAAERIPEIVAHEGPPRRRPHGPGPRDPGNAPDDQSDQPEES